MRTSHFDGLLSTSPAGRVHLVKMLIPLEPHGIFGSNCAYSLIGTFSSHSVSYIRYIGHCYIGHSATGTQNGDDHFHRSKSLVKMLITLELHSIF